MSFITSKDVTPTMSIIAGSSSGLLVRFIIAPIDIIKIRLQLHSINSHHGKYKSITSTILSIYKNEGLTAFWKGNVPAELMYIVYGGAQFTSFTIYSKLWDDNISSKSPIKNLIVGGMSGCTATCISYPFDLLRTHLASNDTKKFNSMSKLIFKIFKKTGFTGFFNGSLISLNYVALSTGISFGLYGFIINTYENVFKDSDKNTGLHKLIAYSGGITTISGVLTGLTSKSITYPLDLIKRRIQINNQSWFKNFQHILKIDGVRGLYRGLLPALIKSVPATGLSFVFFEFFTGLMKGVL